MVEIGFVRGSYDNCVYIKVFSDGSRIYLFFYVDDMFVVVKNMEVVVELKKEFSFRFEMKDLGVVKKILGMEIIRNRGIGELWLF